MSSNRKKTVLHTLITPGLITNCWTSNQRRMKTEAIEFWLRQCKGCKVISIARSAQRNDTLCEVSFVTTSQCSAEIEKVHSTRWITRFNVGCKTTTQESPKHPSFASPVAVYNCWSKTPQRGVNITPSLTSCNRLPIHTTARPDMHRIPKWNRRTTMRCCWWQVRAGIQLAQCNHFTINSVRCCCKGQSWDPVSPV